MSVIQSTALDSYGGSGGQVSGNSIRLRASFGAYLSRTQVTPTLANTGTLSIWVKNSTEYPGDDAYLFAGGGASTSGIALSNATGTPIRVANAGYNVSTANRYNRDYSAWSHHVFSFTTGAWNVYTNATPTSNGTNSLSNLNTAGQLHQIGYGLGKSVYFDGYIAEVQFVDGQVLTPDAFGEYDAVTGQWVPNAYSGSYGNNGFYLDFKDGTSLTTLGYDKSGNNNHWTLRNVSLTSGYTYDWMLDYPTNNYSTLNVLKNYAAQALIWGSLFYHPTTDSTILGTHGMSSGKWYWEVLIVNNAGSQAEIGIASDVFSPSGNDFTMTASGYAYMGAAKKRNNGTTVAYGTTFTNGDVIGVALDLDAKTLTFYKNNVSQGVAYSGIRANTYFAALGNGNSAEEKVLVINFGQQPFTYAAPAGFKTLCTQNLPDPAVKKSTDQFKSILTTGATIKATAQGIFTNEIAWMRDTLAAANGQVADSARDINSILQPNTTAIGSAFVTPTNASLGFVWNMGTSAENTTGTISSTTWANPISGVSVVTYTGTGVAGTIGHNIGKAPAFILVKKTSAVGDWVAYHQTQGATKHILLNSAAGSVTATRWNNTAPTASVFSVGTDTTVNAAGATYVAYCFAEIDGFSKFGSYTGNSSSDGPFINLGFRPSFWMHKSFDGSGHWNVYDAAWDTGNVMTNIYYANNTSLGAGTPMDMVSNGVKVRANATGYNISGVQYFYIAFAEAPFKYALAR